MRAVFAVVAAFALAGAAHAQPSVLPIKPLRERLRTIEVTVNGQKGEFLLDTGGGATIISPAFAKKIGCEPWGRLTGFRMFGQRLDTQRCEDVRIEVAGVKLKPITAGVLDAPDLKPGTTPPDGSLALDTLDDRVFTLEVAANRITLETPDSLRERIKGARELPIRLSRELSGGAVDIYARVNTRKGPLWFILDSGNGGTVLVAKDMAGFFGLDPNKEGSQPVRFDLAPGVPVESEVGFTPEMIMDGNLGMPFLKRYVITVDMPNARMWIRPVAPAS